MEREIKALTEAGGIIPDNLRRPGTDEQETSEHALEAEKWMKFIREVISSGYTSRMGLLYHWYSGGVRTEEFTIKSRLDIPISEASPDLFMEMEQDRLYQFCLA
ncbi:hypothetical protein H1S01_06970 [Heliobacterium chlorum]|uniref:Uncharacterized protein n=1 Tax=Heliobacterium chlorum TaxID=2698 RepID=A0ABR7T3X2_HELCL|nr:hypothetical protein [Heliobacterium chlorum]MBC9784251.1 hypothetical protein [Heliobacterium chlorum]